MKKMNPLKESKYYYASFHCSEHFWTKTFQFLVDYLNYYLLYSNFYYYKIWHKNKWSWVAKIGKFRADLSHTYYLVGPGVVRRCLMTGSGLSYLENLLTWLFLILELKYSPILFNYVDLWSSKYTEWCTWARTQLRIIIFFVSCSFWSWSLGNFIIYFIWVLRCDIIVRWAHLLPIISSWAW